MKPYSSFTTEELTEQLTSLKAVYRDYQAVAEYYCPDRITGYEYEVLACEEGIQNHWVESPDMPHAEILAVMEMMDELRHQWGVIYPNDKR